MEPVVEPPIQQPTEQRSSQEAVSPAEGTSARRPDRVRLDLPAVQLDELLGEVQARLESVVATRDRVHALLEATVSIGADLDLETVLRRIVQAAATLAEARYGALGVIAEDGEHLSQFITVGITAQEIEHIGGWPRGHGVLGLLIKKPQPLRLEDLTAHQDSSGFPSGHPPMGGFLGVPIRVRGEVFGNLYLTEKTSGGQFDHEDEVVVTALATAAGVAIENARLYEESRHREIWQQAMTEISIALLQGTGSGQVVELIAQRARQVCDADLALILVVDDSGEHLLSAAVDGEHAEAYRALRLPVAEDATGPGSGSLAARVFREGHPILSDDARPAATQGGIALPVPVGAALVVPLGTGSAARGTISLVNRPSRPAFTRASVDLLEPFAAQAAVALELADRRREADKMAMLEDRDRIARDLHDTVIQQLFASAMTLMNVIKISQKPEVSRRVQHVVDDLDSAIHQIRSSIFAIQTGTDEEPTLRHQINEIVDAATENLGFAATSRLDGLLDTAIGDSAAEHLLAVLQEAMSNVARHAHAHHTDVTVTVDEHLTLCVQDDGDGIPDDGRRSGLTNMSRRAHQLGGTLATARGDDGGTVLTWQIPTQ